MKRNKIVNLIKKERKKKIILKKFFKNIINYQLIRFLIVGIINTLGSTYHILYYSYYLII